MGMVCMKLWILFSEGKALPREQHLRVLENYVPPELRWYLTNLEHANSQLSQQDTTATSTYLLGLVIWTQLAIGYLMQTDAMEDKT
eukprot:12680285-Ditylum_brightwellii.AAC.1